MESGKPRVGDEVKLTIEGKVTYVEDSGFTVDETTRVGAHGVFFRYDNPSLKNVEVTMRQRRVGDVVTRNDLMFWEPPEGTLIQFQNNGRYWLKLISPARWVDSHGVLTPSSAMSAGSYVILTIGGVA